MENLTTEQKEIIQDTINKIRGLALNYEFDFTNNNEEEITIPCETSGKCESIYLNINTR